LDRRQGEYSADDALSVASGGVGTAPIVHRRAACYDPAMSPELSSYRQRILELAAQHGVRNVRVFGSAARGEDGPDSDLDLLVEVERGRSLLDLIGLEQDVSALLGRSIDVVSERGLSPYLRQRILAEAVAL